MLVSATEMINKAHEGHYAIAQFNINNMEWIKAILLGCEAKKSPVILFRKAPQNTCAVTKTRLTW